MPSTRGSVRWPTRACSTPSGSRRHPGRDRQPAAAFRDAAVSLRRPPGACGDDGRVLRRHRAARPAPDGMAGDGAAAAVRRARAALAVCDASGSRWRPGSALFVYDPVHVGTHAYFAPKLLLIALGLGNAPLFHRTSYLSALAAEGTLPLSARAAGRGVAGDLDRGRGVRRRSTSRARRKCCFDERKQCGTPLAL